MKTQVVPPFLRGFFNVFQRLTSRWDYGQIFSDFLTIAVCCHAWQTEEKQYFETIEQYNREELEDFAKMMGEWILAHSEHQQKEGGWLDSLGTFYELILSKSKSQAFGQFFTPPALCDVMSQLTYKDEDFKQNILDCCAGSGRLLLSMDAIKPGFNHFTAADKDLVCVKMCALNMMIHGLVGVVHHMDSLSLDHYGSYEVNSFLMTKGLPSIMKVREKPRESELEQIQEATKGQQIVFDF